MKHFNRCGIFMTKGGKDSLDYAKQNKDLADRFMTLLKGTTPDPPFLYIGPINW